MTEKTPIDKLRSTIRRCLAIFIVGMLLSVGHSWWARQQNCDLVTDALNAYTVGLLRASSDPDRPRTPDEQAGIDQRVQILRDTYEPVLADCA